MRPHNHADARPVRRRFADEHRDKLAAGLLEPRCKLPVRLFAHCVPIATVAERGENTFRHAVPIAVVHTSLDSASEVGEPVGELRAARDAEHGRANVRRENKQMQTARQHDVAAGGGLHDGVGSVAGDALDTKALHERAVCLGVHRYAENVCAGCANGREHALQALDVCDLPLGRDAQAEDGIGAIRVG